MLGDGRGPSGPTLIILFLVGCSLFTLLTLTSPSVSAPIGSPDRGRAIYLEHCLSCHGLSGNGDGAEAPYLSPRPASLISAATSAKSDKELLQIIDQGKPHTSMRAWSGMLTNEEQRDVVAYIRSLIQFRPPSPDRPPPSESGR
ncbi:MAG: cytochrome c [Nitrospiraceae bacterium]